MTGKDTEQPRRRGNFTKIRAKRMFPLTFEMKSAVGELAKLPIETVKRRIKENGVMLLPSTMAYIKAIGEGKTPKEAASISGLPRPMARENFRACLLAVLSTACLNEEAIVENLHKGMNATKSISVTTADADSKTVEYVDVPDWQARARFTDMVLKVRGDYAPSRQQVTGAGGGPVQRVNVQVNTDFEGLRALIASRKGRNGCGNGEP